METEDETVNLIPPPTLSILNTTHDGLVNNEPAPNILNMLPQTSNRETLNSNSTTEKPKQDYLYTEKDGGPYRVYVELDTQDRQKSINKISVGRMMRRIHGVDNNVTDIKNAGKRKVLVYLNTFLAANRLVQTEIVKNHGYKTYIPKHLVTVSGVISGIPEDISTAEILQDIRSFVPIIEVYRLTQYIKETNKKEPTHRVSVTFRSNILPETVKIYNCSIKVEPFKRKAVLCLKCLRFNHKADDCRGARRCQTCGEAHQTEEEFTQCGKPRRCIYCRNADHGTTDERCPEWQRQRNIKALMAKKAITFFEAKAHFPVNTSNRYNALVDFVDEPTIEESFAHIASRNSFKRATDRRRQSDAEKQGTTYTDENRKRVRNESPKGTRIENRGAGLNNTEKVNDQERWKKKLEEAKQQQKETSQSTINQAIQEALMKYYTAIVADVTLKGKARSNLIETSKKFVSFDVIYKN